MSKVKVYWIDENGDRKDVDIGGEGYVLPTASKTTKGGIKVGSGLEMSGATLNCTVEGDSFFHDVPDFACFPHVSSSDSAWDAARFEQDFVDYIGRPSKQGDIVLWNDSGSNNGYAYRSADKWYNLGSESWADINPILSVADRAKLDGLKDFTLGTTPLTVEGGMWIAGGAS